jgi:hypothetical protein
MGERLETMSEPPKPRTLAEAAENVQNMVANQKEAQTAFDDSKRSLATCIELVQGARAEYREIERSMRDVLGPKSRGPRKSKEGVTA